MRGIHQWPVVYPHTYICKYMYIDQESVELEFLFFSSFRCVGQGPYFRSFMTPKRAKMRSKFRFFHHFLKKALLCVHETRFTGILEELSAVCKSWIPGGIFSAQKGPKWVKKAPKNAGFFLYHFLKQILLRDPETWFTGRWNELPGVHINHALKGHILGPFLTPKTAKIGKNSSFQQFCKTFPLGSFETFF